MSRYKKNKKARNNSEKYEEVFEKRGREFIDQTRTMPFSGLDFDTINASKYIWKSTDSLQRLSHIFYGTYKFWWVIGFVNKKPTDAHYSIGDEIYIPSDPYLVYNKIGS